MKPGDVTGTSIIPTTPPETSDGDELQRR